jgi:hypothetical protein
MKTSEMTGAALDWAVAKCEGATDAWRSGAPFLWDGVPCIRIYGHDVDYTPSTNWAQGGPIIERERIDVLYEHDLRWIAVPQKGIESYGPTPLIAAMRCFVASKLGDEVEIPEELNQGESK